ncbi:MAG: cysteine desulfurase family protein [Candidatus Eisenbacteria bacterium]|nr:cysteine desulfurase family protein [Candidatus Eisenbacteria bacterium]
MDPIYLDHNATTPVDPEVLDAMLPYLRSDFGNPSSSHPFGRRARQAVENARADVASLIGAHVEEIVFTSGGTEASLLALVGGAEAIRARSGGRRLSFVSFTLEHPATLQPLEALRAKGDTVHLVPPDPEGIVRLDKMLETWQLTTQPDIVSLMHAQNEIGVLQPVDMVGRMARSRGTLFHVDAAQTAGKIPLHVTAIGCDLLTIAGHKLYAPKGVGALYVRSGVELLPVLPGAGQERGLRGGTENVPGIVGLGAACRLAARRLAAGESDRLRALRDRLWSELESLIPGIVWTAPRVATLPNTLHVRFPGVTGNALLNATPEIAASTGSACHAGRDEAPAAILALGTDEAAALGSVRLSLGHGNDEVQILEAARALAAGWEKAVGG